MLSIENPLSDSHLKASDDDDNDDDNIKTSSSQIEVVDLLNSDFVDNHNNNSPSHIFSIRDYVFSSRNKDIATNWPFSEKNLQLCQKHGVTNLLPPFQPLNSVRFSSVKRSTVCDILPDQANRSNLVTKTTNQVDQYDLVSSDGATCIQKLNLDHLRNTSRVSDQGEKEFPTEVKKSHPEKDSEAAILLEPSTKQVEAASYLPVTCKDNKIIKPESPVKKSRLIAKLGTFPGSSTKEDNMTNSFIVSEIMASKVCPVCKTFSSSSNTTLNAHIDRCLSGESTMKWTADPQVIKHRIKPRKTRLIGDIYATALHCTLEDLDRRNGTNWATNSTPPDQLEELCVKERVDGLPTTGVEEIGHEGEVYIDTDGTKVRILSKFSESTNVEGSYRAQNIHSGSKFLTDKKKKKHHLQKHQKFLKLVPHDKPCSSKSHPRFEACGGPSTNIAARQIGEKEVQLAPCSKSQEQTQLNDSGIIRQWVGSKRTGLTKKTTPEDKHQHSGHNLKDSVGEKSQFSLAKSYTSTKCLLNKQQSSRDRASSQSSKKMEASKTESSIGLSREQPPLKRRREEFPWSSEGVSHRKRSVISPKHKKLRKERTSMHDSFNSSSDRAATGASSLSKKIVPTKTSDDFVVTSKSSRGNQALSSKSAKFTSTRTELPNQVIMPKFRFDVKRKSSVPTQIARMPSQSDDQHLYSMEDTTNEQSQMEKDVVKMSRSQTRVLRIRNDKGAVKFSRKEEAADCLKNLPSEPRGYGRGVGESKEFSPVNFGSALEDSEESSDDEESEREETQNLPENVATDQPALKVGIGGFASVSNSFNSEFHELPCSSEKHKSEQCDKVNQRDSCGRSTSLTDPSMVDNKELFSAYEVGNVVIGEDNHTVAKLDSKDEQVNNFSEVDPIPIPGPPGSFLPSLGHMGSDDLLGNTPLTTYRVQSTEDQHDLVERDKSDSPISAISDIYNPAWAVSESRSSKNLFIDPIASEEEIRRGFSGAAQVSPATNLGAQQLNPVKSSAVFPEMAPVSLKFEQSCRCSRKEGAQGVALNLQESQLLRGQPMQSVRFSEFQMDNDCSERYGNLNSRSGMFSHSNYPNCGPGKVAAYPTKILASEHNDKNVSVENEVRFSAHRDLDCASPSASNPVLRLMGKNLMVANKDEVASLQNRQHQPSSLNTNPCLQSSTLSEVSPGVGNKDYYSYHQVVAQSPLVYKQDRKQDAIRQQYNANWSANFEVCADVRTPLTPSHAPGVKFPSMNAAGAFKASLGQLDYKGGINMLTEEQRSYNRPDKPLSYGLEKNVITSGAKGWGVDSTSGREIIIIDDATDNEAASAINTKCNNGMGRIPVSSSSYSVPGASEFSTRFVTPYYSNQLDHAGSLYGGQPTLHNVSFQVPISEGINASPVKWNRNPEGVSFLRQVL